jgi:hypothetical protein
MSVFDVLDRSIISSERWSECNLSKTSVQICALRLAMLQVICQGLSRSRCEADRENYPNAKIHDPSQHLISLVTMAHYCHQTGNCVNISCINMTLFYILLKLTLTRLPNFNVFRCNQFKSSILIGAGVSLTYIRFAAILTVCYPLYLILHRHDCSKVIREDTSTNIMAISLCFFRRKVGKM